MLCRKLLEPKLTAIAQTQVEIMSRNAETSMDLATHANV
jgi:hypothetical protein